MGVITDIRYYRTFENFRMRIGNVRDTRKLERAVNSSRKIQSGQETSDQT